MGTNDQKPANVVLLMADQHNPFVLGAYGNPVVKTPNLDALADRGSRFEAAYCPSPICVPSRASLATGRESHEIASWDNASPYIGTEAASWGHDLTDAGHPVVTIGKLHFRSVADPTGFPDQRHPLNVHDGIGDSRGLLRGDMPPGQQCRDQIDLASVGESEYTAFDRRVADEAVSWLRTEAPQLQEPWVLWVSFASPHNPLIVPPEHAHYDPADMPLPFGHGRDIAHPADLEHHRLQGLVSEVPESSIRSARAAYYGLVSFIDAQIGRVLDEVDRSGLADRTVVIYTSDHGDLLGDHGLWWKGSLYESAARVPLIAAGPGFPAGSAVDTPVSLVDLYPTIVGAACPGRSLPDDLTGTDLAGVAAGAEPHRSVLSQYHAVWSRSASYMVRWSNWKYIHHVGGPPQLFDVAKDPAESTDLATDPAHVAALTEGEARLREILDPTTVHDQAHQDQQAKIEALGGAERILDEHTEIGFTAPPEQ